MFVIYQEGENRFPVKVWLNDPNDLDDICLKQATNLSNLPFVHHHVALMPDCHAGFGMPIGGVLATKDVIIPNAVGVDIGCGIAFAHTNIPASIFKTKKGSKIAQQIVADIMAAIPVGFSHHKKRQPCQTLDSLPDLIINDAKGLPAIDEGYYQVGTLGGGNHFIELQEDEEGLLGIMVHSGSRNFGYKVATFFNKEAKALNQKMGSQVPTDFDLAYLPVDDTLGQAYIQWMNLAMSFAQENRTVMLRKTTNIVLQQIAQLGEVDDVKVDLEVNAHHNYAALEEHFGEKVWVHRKGAIRAFPREFGIIPGAMGSYSYIVQGLGNPESFMSCSHGAGRTMGRKEARRKYLPEEVRHDLEKQGVVAFGSQNKREVPEEYRKAYKNIDTVIAHSADLVKPVLKLKTLAVVKG